MTTRKRMCTLALLVFLQLLLSFCQAFALTIDYQYDNLYRLVAETRSDGLMVTYRYDAAGNRLTKTAVGLVKGDLNGDGLVNPMDAIIGLQIVTGKSLTGPVFPQTGVDGDGKIGMAEVIYILQKSSAGP